MTKHCETCSCDDDGPSILEQDIELDPGWRWHPEAEKQWLGTSMTSVFDGKRTRATVVAVTFAEGTAHLTMTLEPVE